MSLVTAFLFRLLGLFSLFALAGCTASPLQRDKMTHLKSIEIVSVPAPAIDVPTFMQAWARSGTGGFIQAAIAQAQQQSEAPKAGQGIPDYSSLVAQKLESKLKNSWLPAATYLKNNPGAFNEQGTAQMRVEVFVYELAPMTRRVFVGTQVSILDGSPAPLWVGRSLFSGLVHGGESIDLDTVMADPSQLLRELDRAAEWTASDLVQSIK